MITLKELCKEGNVTRRTIQCFEKKGLIKPCSKNKMGYLLYNDETIKQVKQIRFYQQIGFSLTEIKNFKGLSKIEMYKYLNSQLPILKNKRKEIDTNISTLIDIINEEIDFYVL